MSDSSHPDADDPMNKYAKREQIISYVSPHVVLFPTQYALVFGTRHGVSVFVEDILSLYGHGYFKSVSSYLEGLPGKTLFPRQERSFRRWSNAEFLRIALS
jgi:hypothetical protein